MREENMLDIFKSIMYKIKLRCYNEYTIAEFFRKQGAIIGENCRIYITSLAGEPYLVKIGNHVAIAAHVILITHDGAVWVHRQKNKTINRYGTIEIKDNSFIGVGSIIMPNVKIGPNSVVGAGSVVRTDVPENCVVAGNPARFICKTDEYIEICKKESIELPKYIKDSIKSETEANRFGIIFKDLLIEHFRKKRIEKE
jgi:acetyltransferase-like isoleucine patch superfamily enzyme